MHALSKSGFSLPNRFARIALETTEEMVGGGATMEALLSGAQLSHLIGSYPPANLERGFDFAEFAALNLGMEALYGPKGGRGLALRVGRQTFARALSNFGALAGTADVGFKVLPLNVKLRLGLSALARIFSEISDQTSSLEDQQHEFHYLVQRNATCWSRSGEDKPVCYFMVGLLQETLHSISGGREFRVDEAECQAMGHKACRFVIQKKPLT